MAIYQTEDGPATETDYDFLNRSGLFPLKTWEWFDGSEQTY